MEITDYHSKLFCSNYDKSFNKNLCAEISSYQGKSLSAVAALFDPYSYYRNGKPSGISIHYLDILSEYVNFTPNVSLVQSNLDVMVSDVSNETYQLGLAIGATYQRFVCNIFFV